MQRVQVPSLPASLRPCSSSVDVGVGGGVGEAHLPFTPDVYRVWGVRLGAALPQLVHTQQRPAVVLHVQAVGGGSIT